jgi:hypothetical protein
MRIIAFLLPSLTKEELWEVVKNLPIEKDMVKLVRKNLPKCQKVAQRKILAKLNENPQHRKAVRAIRKKAKAFVESVMLDDANDDWMAI